MYSDKFSECANLKCPRCLLQLARLREYLRGVIKGRRIKIYVATYKPKKYQKWKIYSEIERALSLKKAMGKSDEKFFSLFLFW